MSPEMRQQLDSLDKHRGGGTILTCVILVKQVEHLPILGDLLFGELYGRLFDKPKSLVGVSPSHCAISGFGCVLTIFDVCLKLTAFLESRGVSDGTVLPVKVA